jgi:peptidyl-prolyl cis-trans isomerase C
MRHFAVPCALVCILATACGRSAPKPGDSKERVVAQVGQGVVTFKDLDERWRVVAGPNAGAGAADQGERKGNLLKELMQLEAAAEEARRRGYDRDPQIQRALKQQLVARLLREEIDTKLTVDSVPEADVERYHQEHAAEFQRGDQVRASAIFVADEAAARKVAALARAARVPSDPLADARGFRQLVLTHSRDETSKQRGGDLAFFERTSPTHPAELVAAAFALGEIGDVSGPVKTREGWVVLKLTQKLPGFVRTLAEVRPIIRQRLLHDLRRKRTEELMQSLLAKVKVEVDEGALADVGKAQAAGRGNKTR